MKLQVACDVFDLDEVVRLIEQVGPFVDIIEVGTPLMLSCGVEAIRKLRSHWPNIPILADAKIADGGYAEAAHCFSAGASYVTALALADNATIVGCLDAAAAMHGTMVIDLLCVDDLVARARALESLGVQCVGVHTGVDSQAAGRTPLGDLRAIRATASNMQVSVAGGIGPGNVGQYLAYQPDIVVVGSAITGARDPSIEAAAISQLIHTANTAKEGAA